MALKKMSPNQLIDMSSTDGWELEFQNFQGIAQTHIKENEIQALPRRRTARLPMARSSRLIPNQPP